MYRNMLKKTLNNAKTEVGKSISEAISVSLEKTLSNSVNKGLSFLNTDTVNDQNKHDQSTNDSFNANYYNSLEVLSEENDNEQYRDEDDKFLDDISSRVYETGVESLKSPNQALNAIDSLVDIVKDVEKFREVQKTKRTAIEANKDVLVTKINAQKAIIMQYLEKTFDERKDAFSKYFSVVDDALKKDNIEQLAMGLDKVSELAKSSPFKELADINKVGLALQDKDHEWDF